MQYLFTLTGSSDSERNSRYLSLEHLPLDVDDCLSAECGNNEFPPQQPYTAKKCSPQ
ncbi:hypothetical protein HMPREF1979_02541 [Actinomyces johnsonii F0542]|uniref:Uncharacterized protein n=1 Tax=Actinomyces johnsonii F0542 TaxID=1321818 RepID=U1QKY1_9ACTO|nr:hypothetical protein HMPREF1979_02541 [Actinomyces johnsonii F0542]